MPQAADLPPTTEPPPSAPGQPGRRAPGTRRLPPGSSSAHRPGPGRDRFSSIAAAPTTAAAAQETVAALRGAGPVAAVVLLRRRDALRNFAAAGIGRVHAAIALDAGAVGQAYAGARTVIECPVNRCASAYPAGPHTVSAMSVPVLGGNGTSLGVLRLEWTEPPDIPAWKSLAEAAATALGRRLPELGHTGTTETSAERLVRYAYDITAAKDLPGVLAATLRAARELMGASTAVGIRLPPGADPVVQTEPGRRTVLTRRVTGVPAEHLTEIAQHTHRYGSWHTSTEPGGNLAGEAQALLDIGARTVVAVPLGRPGEDAMCRTLVVLDSAVRPPAAQDVGLLELLASQALLSYERNQLLESLREQARRDPLTGLGHQATFAEYVRRAKPHRTALLLIDVDRFKQINDTRGHAAGDRALTELSESLRGTLRPDDELFRIGGDEFVAVADIRAGPAGALARRIVQAAHRAGATVSVGVSVLGDRETPDQALRRADEAMYRAKKAGRDRFEVAPPDGAGP